MSLQREPGAAIRTKVIDRWDAAAASYEDTIERRTGAYVPLLLERLNLAPRDRVVDVACGTGAVALELAQAGATVLAVDHSSGMVRRLRERMAEEGLGELVTAAVGDATALGLPDGHAAATVSNFGVIFCPDVDKAVAEMARVTRPEGTMAITAWTPLERNGLSHLRAMDSAALGFEVPTPGGFAWADTEALRQTFLAAGLVELRIEEHAGPAILLESWQGFRLMFKSPAFASMFDGLDEEQGEIFVEAFLEQARATHGEGPIELPKQAWVVSAQRPPAAQR